MPAINVITNFIQQILPTSQEKVFYKFRQGNLILDNDWKIYFQQHQTILRGFIYWHLNQFLQKHNPNVIGLSKKLFKPPKRKLQYAYKFWGNYISIKGFVTCIYTKRKLQANLSIDHFIPWSYTTHDLLWNLTPTINSVNISKSNALPNLDRYLNYFINLQFDAFQTISQSNLPQKDRLLEDYIQLVGLDLASIDKKRFVEKLANTIRPMVQVAGNMGFTKNWTYH